MATQKVRPGQDRDERRRVQRRQVRRTITVGTLMIAAVAGALAVLVAVLAVGPDRKVAPTATESTVEGDGSAQAGAGLSVAGPPDEAFFVGFKGLPPATATPSAPMTGDLVKSFGPTHGEPWSAAYLYADGRLIWAASLGSSSGSATTWIEQRLSRSGVAMVRSATTLNTEGLPATAWESRELKPYVPSRYMVVATFEYLFGEASRGNDHPPVKHELPGRVQELLRRGDRIVGSGLEMTTGDARTLTEILPRFGFDPIASGMGVLRYTSGRLYGIDFKRHELVIEFHPVLPDGRVPSMHVER